MVEINTSDLIDCSVNSKLTNTIADILAKNLSNEDKENFNLWLKSIHYNKVAVSREEYKRITGNSILLYPCETMVETKVGKIVGMIVAISMRFEKVQYEIQYFKDGEDFIFHLDDNHSEITLINEHCKQVKGVWLFNFSLDKNKWLEECDKIIDQGAITNKNIW